MSGSNDFVERVDRMKDVPLTDEEIALAEWAEKKLTGADLNDDDRRIIAFNLKCMRKGIGRYGPSGEGIATPRAVLVSMARNMFDEHLPSPQYQRRPSSLWERLVWGKKGKPRIRTFESIHEDLYADLQQADAEYLEKVRKAYDERNALFERAGIKYVSGDLFDDRWRDESYWRSRIREQTFNVPDPPLRKEVMAAADDAASAQWQRWNNQESFYGEYLAGLIRMRCEPSPNLPDGRSLGLSLALAGAAYWLGGLAGLLVIGFGVILPAWFYYAHRTMMEAHKYDVALQEMTKLVERDRATAKDSARRYGSQSRIFSHRELYTGEPDKSGD